ncbi:alpha-2-macroglobulin [Aplysia californica]|uniref:Alpha-2-macroglobulin n=1 Tax=Aplysia californica TaxID=6500 RepID=A0ABM0JLS7_APLCA|nr:alpha-2-macroglobulin [Aplysia californica]
MWTGGASMWRFVIVVCAVLVELTSGAFLGLIPREARPGWPLRAVLAFLDRSSNLPAQVTVTLWETPPRSMPRAIDQKTASVDSGNDLIMMDFQLPELLDSRSYLRATFECSGGETFKKTETLIINGNTSVVLVQTDKNIYKPGQTVKFRVLNVDKTLKPTYRPLTVTIINALDNKIEQFYNISSRSGVVEKTFHLGKFPVLGDWKIHVTDEFEMSYSTSFKVEEFVLPRFSVDVAADPNYLVGTSLGTTITVTSLYTYGEGVQGKCEIKLKVRGWTFARTYAKAISPGGKAQFEDIDWDYVLQYSTGKDEIEVEITASVTDETGRTEVGEKVLNIYKHDAKIEILDSSSSVLRKEIPSKFFVHVSDLQGNPLPSAEVELSIRIPQHKDVVLTQILQPGQTDITFSFVPEIYSDLFYNYYDVTVKASLTSNPSVYAKKTIRAADSEEGIALEPRSQSPLVGDTAEFKIFENKGDSGRITKGFLVTSQGNIVDGGMVSGDRIRLDVKQEMCPSANVAVFMMTSGSIYRVVADVVSITPQACLNKKVSVKFDTTEARVGSEVGMRLAVDRTDGSNAMPGEHSVYYLAVDKSIVLLEGSSDLDEGKVKSALGSLKLKSALTSDSAANNAGMFFMASGLVVFSDATVGEEHRSTIYFKGDVVALANDVAMAESSAGSRPILGDSSKRPDIAIKKKGETANPVRKNFPDTWLWGSIETGMDGRVVKPVTLPHTITSWVVSAFAINREGLAVTSGPVELLGFQTFFLSMNLPYNLKRGEVFSLRVTVFNYRGQALDTVVRLRQNSSQFAVDNAIMFDGWFEKTVSLRPNLASSVEFKIRATTVGYIDLQVQAGDPENGPFDQVQRKLLVKPEGVERRNAMTEILTVDEGVVSETFKIDWPYEKMVPDSQRVAVKITGDVLGQALANLDKLVTQPFGCGEQNMITTVPNIFGVRYIKSTDQVGMDDLVNKMIENMKFGYQRQVSRYRHRDGSFSAWGEGSSNRVDQHSSEARTPGSTWLTAFVIKSFAQASLYIDVSNEVLTKGIEFLKSVQKFDGSFEERGKIIHQGMTSGTSKGPALTVYVLAAMLEVRKFTQTDLNVEINKAMAYMKQVVTLQFLSSRNQMFLGALTAYTLSLVPERTDDIIDIVDNILIIVEENGASWSPFSKEEIVPPSKMVEMGAYCLLAYTHMDQLNLGLPIMKWLQAEQNSEGGFHSTQDTVMTLQAFSDFGMLSHRATPSSMVTVTDPATGKSIKVDISGSRSVLLQTVELPANTTQVNVTLTGPTKAISVVKVVYYYHTYPGKRSAPKEPLVSLWTQTSRVSPSVHRVKTCVKSSNKLTEDSMMVASLIMPSGERVLDDVTTLMRKNPHAKRIEPEDTELHFYTDGPPGSGYCFEADLESEIDFEVQKPGSAKFYSYYEPEISSEVPLVLNISCRNDDCNGIDGAVPIHLANVLLTVMICSLVSLLASV